MADQYYTVPKGTLVFDVCASTVTAAKRTFKVRAATENTPNAQKHYQRLVSHFSHLNGMANFAKSGDYVCWSDGEKLASLQDLITVDAPVKKEPTASKVKAPTLRSRLIKGSKWKLTQPATVIKPGNPQTLTNGRGWSYTEYSPVPDYDLPAGTEIEITGKSTTSVWFKAPGLPVSAWFTGIWFPIKATVNGQLIEAHLSYSEINKNPEVVGEEIKQYIFAIYDTEKGEYYKDYDYDWVARRSVKLNYVSKITQCKRFKRLADVRAHCLVQSGYYDNLPDTWGVIPDWLSGPKTFDIPTTWVIHKIDKATKQLEETIELIDTFNRSWRLRELTVQYGSAVRTIYADLEKKGKLDEFNSILMFKGPEQSYWGHELTPQEISEVEFVINQYGGVKTKICKTATGFAIALSDSAALMVCLAYSGSLKMVAIDFATMSAKMKEKEQA